MLSWWTTKVAAYVAAGAVLAAIAASAVAWVQHRAAAGYEAERDAARAELELARQAATGARETVTALEGAVEQFKALCTPAADVQAAAGRVDAAADELRRQARAIASAEEGDLGRPDCEALLSTDLAAACPGHARGVRDRALRDLQRSAGAGPDPRRPADP